MQPRRTRGTARTSALSRHDRRGGSASSLMASHGNKRRGCAVSSGPAGGRTAGPVPCRGRSDFTMAGSELLACGRSIFFTIIAAPRRSMGFQKAPGAWTSRSGTFKKPSKSSIRGGTERRRPFPFSKRGPVGCPGGAHRRLSCCDVRLFGREGLSSPIYLAEESGAAFLSRSRTADGRLGTRVRENGKRIPCLAQNAGPAPSGNGACSSTSAPESP
jgi:hypothetical protein